MTSRQLNLSLLTNTKRLGIQMNRRAILLPTVPVIMAVLFSSSAFACATCGCTLSSDAAMGYSAEAGWRVTIEEDFINQDQLRSGADPISAYEAAKINTFGGNQEIEHQTINRYTTIGINYSPSVDWNFNLLVPYVDRSHSTYGAAPSDEINQGSLSDAEANGLGDLKLLVDYQGILPTHNLGVPRPERLRERQV
jgi:hypothetical protein